MSAYMLIYGYIQVSASHAFDFHGRQAALDKLNNMKVQVHDHNKIRISYVYLQFRLVPQIFFKIASS